MSLANLLASPPHCIRTDDHNEISFSELVNAQASHEYTSHARLLADRELFEEINPRNTNKMVVPHFCYYHEVTCPGGPYRLAFFGPLMNEREYLPTELLLALTLQERDS